MELFHDSIVYYGTHAPSQRGVGVLHRTPRYHCPEQELPHKHKIEREQNFPAAAATGVTVHLYIHVCTCGRGRLLDA